MSRRARKKNESSRAAAALISSDSESSDNECQPPPPPPAPPPPSEPLVFRRQRERAVQARNLRLSIQFHRKVVLLRSFHSWRERTKLTKRLLREAWILMKRSLLLWHAVAEEAASRRQSLLLLCSVADKHQSHLLSSFLCRWREYTDCARLLETSFAEWRQHTRREADSLRAKECIAAQHNRRSLVESTFSLWRYQAMISSHQNHHARRCKSIVLLRWRRQANQQRTENEQKIVALSNGRDRRAVQRAFNSLASHAAKMRRYRSAFASLTGVSRHFLLRRGLDTWLDTSRTCTRYEQFSHLLSQAAANIQKRMVLASWSSTAALQNCKERAQLATIMNRWQLLIQDRKRRQAKNEQALRFWAHTVCKRTLRQWKEAVRSIREGQKQSFKRSMHCNTTHFSSLCAGSSSSLRPNLYPTRSDAAGEGSRLHVSNIRARPVPAASTSTWNASIASSQTVPRTPAQQRALDTVGKEFNVASSTSSHRQPILNGGRHSSSTTSSSNSSSPFGVRIPSWIQDEMVDRAPSSTSKERVARVGISRDM